VWLPLTFLAARGAGPALTWMVRLDLYLVAVASLHLWYVISRHGPRRPLWAYRLAQLGCAFFCFQTVIMDALVWGSLFHA
jgi:hypothetical protein